MAYHRVTLKLRPMKKLFALLSVSLLFLTLIFKTLDFPATALLLIVTLVFSFPIFFILDFIGEWKSGASKLLSSVYFVAVLTLSQGLFFKIMHWPFGDQLLLLSLGLILPGYLVLRAIIQPNSNKLANFSVLLFISLCWTSLFLLLNFPGNEGFFAVTLLLTMLVILYELVKKEGQPIFQLVKHRHLVNVSGIIMFLLLINANRMPIRVLETDMTRHLTLQEQIDNEIALGSALISPRNQKLAVQIDAQTADLLRQIDEVKFELISQVNGRTCLGSARPLDKMAVLWSKNPKGQVGIAKLNLAALEQKIAIDATMHQMIGSDFKVLDQRVKGLKIWSSWQKYQRTALAMVQRQNPADSITQRDPALALQLIIRRWDAEEYANYHELRNIHWVSRTFDHSTLVQAILRLTELQYEVVRYRTLALD